METQGQARCRVYGRLLLLAAAAVAVVAARPSAAGELYRWVDDNGEVHYGDRMPAEATPNEHAVIDRGGGVREERGSVAEEEAERARTQEAEAEQRAQSESRAQRDRMLRETFTTEEDLIRTRDRRLGAIDGRIAVVEHQIEQLEAQRTEYREHLDSIRGATSEGASARRMARDRIDDVDARLEKRRATLEGLQQQRQRMAEEFAADLERYRELEARRAGKQE